MKGAAMGRSRRPDARKPGEHTSVSMRMTSGLWHRLDQAAKAAGHSFSHEVEHRLHASFATDDALVGPSEQVIKHLIGAWGTGTDPNDPAEYMIAMNRVITALTTRYPGKFGLDQAMEIQRIAYGIGVVSDHEAMMALMKASGSASTDTSDRETLLSVWDEVRPAQKEG